MVPGWVSGIRVFALAALVATMLGWMPLVSTAQVFHTISVNGETVEVTIETGTFEVTGSGFTSDVQVLVQAYTGVDCTVPAGSVNPVFTDTSGAFSLNLTAGPGVYYLAAVDPILGTSNCLTVNIGDAPTPTNTPTEVPPTATNTATETPTQVTYNPAILINGSAGPIDTVRGATVNITGTGFPPNQVDEIIVDLYEGSNCAVLVLEFSGSRTSSDSSGEISYDFFIDHSFPSVVAVLVQSNGGDSNCIDLNIADATETPTNTATATTTATETPTSTPTEIPDTPAILINGSTGPLNVSRGDTLTLTGTGFPPDQIGSIVVYVIEGPDCFLISDPVQLNVISSNGAGEISLEFPVDADFPASVSVRVDAHLSVSNCVVLNVADPTETPTEVPPTATNTPTETPTELPPTETATETPTNTPTEIPDTPAILINGSAGPVNVSTGETVTLTGTGFPPDQVNNIVVEIYENADCFPDSYFWSGVISSDNAGEITLDLSIENTAPSVISVDATSILGRSNCIVLNVADPTETPTEVPPTPTSTLVPEAPSLSVNGMTGTVTFPTGPEGYVLIGSGFHFPLDLFLGFYGDANCQGSPFDTTRFIPDADGTFRWPITGSSVADQISFLAVDSFTDLSSCLTIIYEDPTPTATSTELPPTETFTPTETPTNVPPTETPTSTSTTVPPTATDVPPTSTVVPSTATDVPPTEEPTQVPVGSAAITITTSTGDEIPDDTSVCIGEVCQDLDALAGNSALNAFVSAAAPSGTTVTFADLEVGTFPLTVSTAGEVVITSEITIEPGVTTALDVTYQLESDSTPVVPTATSDGVQPTQPPVVTLPSTGSGANGSSSMVLLLLFGLLALTGGAAWASRLRRT